MANFQSEQKFRPFQLDETIRKPDTSDNSDPDSPGQSPPPSYQLNESRECGICRQMGEGLRATKLLPCCHEHGRGHFYCLPCLITHFGTPELGEEVPDSFSAPQPLTISVRDQEPSNALDQDVTFPNNCDICAPKGNSEAAVGYCEICKRHYCTTHEISHADFMPGHRYAVVRPIQQRPMGCTKHSDKPIDSGCKLCYTPLCTVCVTIRSPCPEKGALHHIVSPLDDLIEFIRGKFDSLSKDVHAKLGRLTALHTESNELAHTFEADTQNMLRVLQDSRIDQAMEIIDKYGNLEMDFMTRRNETKNRIEKFTMEADGDLRELTGSLQRVKLGLENNQKGHVLTGYQKTKNLVHFINSTGLPSLKLQDVTHLTEGHMHREIELRPSIAAAIDVSEKMMPDRLTQPTSIMLSSEIVTSDYCICVHEYHGNTYVGHATGVDRISEDFRLQRCFINTVKTVWSITAHNDLLYILQNDRKSYLVGVYNLDGQLVMYWTHPDTNISPNKLTIAGDKVVIPNRDSVQLAIYSLTGQIITLLPCPLLGKEGTSICTLNLNRVILASREAGVFCVDIVEGYVIWSSSVSIPRCVASYGEDFVLVSGAYSTGIEIQILNANTGIIVERLTNDTGRQGSRVSDIHVSGNTLVIPRYDEKKVLFLSLGTQ